MALLLAESFDGLGTANSFDIRTYLAYRNPLITGGFSEQSGFRSIDTVTTKSGNGQCCQIHSDKDQGSWINIDIGSAGGGNWNTSYVIGFDMASLASTGHAPWFLTLNSNGNTSNSQWRFDSFYHQDSNKQLRWDGGDVAANPFPTTAETWSHIQVVVTKNGADDFNYDFYVDGSLVHTVSNHSSTYTHNEGFIRLSAFDETNEDDVLINNLYIIGDVDDGTGLVDRPDHDGIEVERLALTGGLTNFTTTSSGLGYYPYGNTSYITPGSTTATGDANLPDLAGIQTVHAVNLNAGQFGTGDFQFRWDGTGVGSVNDCTAGGIPGAVNYTLTTVPTATEINAATLGLANSAGVGNRFFYLAANVLGSTVAPDTSVELARTTNADYEDDDGSQSANIALHTVNGGIFNTHNGPLSYTIPEDADISQYSLRNVVTSTLGGSPSVRVLLRVNGSWTWGTAAHAVTVGENIIPLTISTAGGDKEITDFRVEGQSGSSEWRSHNSSPDDSMRLFGPAPAVSFDGGKTLANSVYETAADTNETGRAANYNYFTNVVASGGPTNLPNYYTGEGSGSFRPPRINLEDGVLFTDYDWSVAAWVASDSSGDHVPLQGNKTSPPDWFKDWEVRYNNSTNALALYYDGSSIGSSTVAAVTAGDWYHVAITYDRATTTVKVYFNGSEEISVVQDMSDSQFSYIEFGEGPTAADVKVTQCSHWVKTLSGDDITSLYNSGDGAAWSGWTYASETSPKITPILFYANGGDSSVKSYGQQLVADQYYAPEDLVSNMGAVLVVGNYESKSANIEVELLDPNNVRIHLETDTRSANNFHSDDIASSVTENDLTLAGTYTLRARWTDFDGDATAGDWQSVQFSSGFDAATTPVTARSIIFDIEDNWGDASYTGLRSIELKRNGVLIANLSPTTYETSQLNASFESENVFDTSLSKTGEGTGDNWYTAINQETNQRLVLVLDSLTEIDEIVVNNAHSNGAYTSRGARNVKITTSTDVITDTTYNADVANSTFINMTEWPQHIDSNIEHNESVWVVPVGSITVKSLVIDVADNHGNASYSGVSLIELLNDGTPYALTPSDFTAYAATEYVTRPVEQAFDTSLGKTGSGDDQTYLTTVDNHTNFRIILVLNTPREIDQLRVNNYHNNEANTDAGFNNIIVTASSDEITDTTHDAAVANSVVLFDGFIREHDGTAPDDNIFWSHTTEAFPPTTYFESDSVLLETLVSNAPLPSFYLSDNLLIETLVSDAPLSPLFLSDSLMVETLLSYTDNSPSEGSEGVYPNFMFFID